MNETSQTQNRTIYFDYLRVLATICVIFNHVDTPVREIGLYLGRLDLLVNLIIDSLATWAVPVFVMISGTIFLSRDIPIKRIYAKYIFRLLIAWYVWSSIYQVFTTGSIYVRMWNITHGIGQIHLWFIHLIIALYIGVPFLKLIIKSENAVKYLFTIAFILSLFFHVSLLIDTYGNDFFRTIKDISGINMYLKLYGSCLIIGYSTYYILGFILNKKELSRQLRIFIYALGIIGLISIPFYLTKSYSNGFNGVIDVKEGYLLANIFFEALAVFVFFKYCNLKQNRYITALSNYSFGAYLVHYLVIKTFSIYFGFNVAFCNPVFSYVIVGIAATATSFLISAFLHQIPLVKKYVV